MRAWLRATGWAIEVAGLEDWLAPGVPVDLAGRTAFDALPSLTAMTIAVTQEPRYFLGGGEVAPSCPECASTAEEDPEFYEALDGWSGPENEPDLSCRRCGFTELIGNWDVRDSGAHGSIGAVLDPHGELVPADRHRPGVPGRTDPEQAAGALLDAVRDHLGGRWVYVHLHV